ncbi:MAG: ATP-grasp domain-containing protein [Candidatus Saccharimonadales bacterium]
MKKILIIGGRKIDETSRESSQSYLDFFTKAAPNVTVEYVDFDDLVVTVAPDEFTVYNHRHESSFESYDAIYFRGRIRRDADLAYCISRFCAVKKIPFANDYSGYRSPSKLSQAIRFYELGVPFLKTIYSLDGALLLKASEAALEYPFIIKDSYGTQGEDNFLVRDQRSAARAVHDNADIRFIAQEFFPNNCDYRVLCVGNDQLIIRRSASDGSHLNNTSQGAAATLVVVDDFPAAIIEQAHLVAKSLGMTIAGIDVLYNDKSSAFAFLEVNSQPQLYSGAFVEEKNALVGRYLAGLL